MMKGPSGAKLISLERTRQQKQENYLPWHDDGHDAGELVQAAIGYAAHGIGIKVAMIDGDGFTSSIWPGNDWDFKPKTPIRDLVRAGALIAAEIDRLRRAATDEGRP